MLYLLFIKNINESYQNIYVSVYLFVCVRVSVCVFSGFRIVKETLTEASLAPGIDQQYNTNS
jgi:hypothetical protein